MAKLLQELKEPPKSSSWKLFMGLGFIILFQKVLNGGEVYEVLLPPPLKILVATILLPLILNV